MSLTTLLALGFFLGMRHATDPDHVVAVATIVARERSLRGAGLVGALWGAGHTLTILLVGGAIVLFGLVLPARLGLSLEFSVAVMLVLLGALNVRAFFRDLPSRSGAHGHLHADPSQPRAHATAPSRLRSVLVGGIHGLAGSAAVALLVLATVRQPAWALLYLALFGLGTIAGMVAITVAMAAPLSYAQHRFELVHRHLGWVAGMVSVALGLFLVCRIGFVDGLFGANPQWDPH